MRRTHPSGFALGEGQSDGNRLPEGLLTLWKRDSSRATLCKNIPGRVTLWKRNPSANPAKSHPDGFVLCELVPTRQPAQSPNGRDNAGGMRTKHLPRPSRVETRWCGCAWRKSSLARAASVGIALGMAASSSVFRLDEAAPPNKERTLPILATRSTIPAWPSAIDLGAARPGRPFPLRAERNSPVPKTARNRPLVQFCWCHPPIRARQHLANAQVRKPFSEPHLARAVVVARKCHPSRLASLVCIRDRKRCIVRRSCAQIGL